MKDYLFFDLDGVILDSMPYHAKAWIEAFSQFGLKFEEREIYLHEGAIELDTAREMFLKKGINPTAEFFKKVFKIQKEIFKKRYAKLVKPFPEVPVLLENLKKEKKKLALVTSSHSEIFNEVFPKELIPYFSVIITGDKIERRKPHPDPYLKALGIFKIKNDKALVVENSPAGVMSAKGANLFCVGITTTLSEEHLSLADLIVKNHKELQEILLNGKKE